MVSISTLKINTEEEKSQWRKPVLSEKMCLARRLAEWFVPTLNFDLERILRWCPEE